MGYFKQNDPFFFAPQIAVLFPRSGFQKMLGQPASGDLTVVIPPSLMAQIRSAGGRGLIVDSKDLDAVSAPSYKRIFSSASAAGQIPFLLGPLSLLPVVGTAITIATSLVDGLNRISATDVNADQLCVLTADGGRFSKVYVLSSVNGQARLGVIIVYAVAVGREARLYQVMSSVYAVVSGP